MTLRNIDVLVVQRGLLAAGHNPGTIDGRWGPNTYDAIVPWLERYLDAYMNELNPEIDSMVEELNNELRRCAQSGWQACTPRPDHALGYTVNWGNYATGVRALTMPSLMVGELTRLANGGAPRVFRTAPAPTPSTPATPTDAEAMLERLMTGGDVTSMTPTNGGPVAPTSTRRIVATQRPTGMRALPYIVGGVALLGGATLVILYIRSRR